jgi:hypothetical protein
MLEAMKRRSLCPAAEHLMSERQLEGFVPGLVFVQEGCCSDLQKQKLSGYQGE